MNVCISDLRIWMIRNKLKMNDSKTEFLIITSSFLKQSFDDLNIMVGDSKIVSSNSARNLGVIFDKCMKLDYHISSVCKSTYFIYVTLVAFVIIAYFVRAHYGSAPIR